MSQILVQPPSPWTAVDLAERFGPLPLSRIRLEPEPGLATEQNVVDLHDRENRLYELVDGILLEKAMGAYESYLAVALIGLLLPFVNQRRLGIVLGADGLIRLSPGLIRIPDVSFISWDRLPGRRLGRAPILDLSPDLAVEIISQNNTRREMEAKLLDYFAAKVRQVWYVEPQRRQIVVYTSPTEFTVYDESQTITMNDILPGFQLDLASYFVEPSEAAPGT